MLPPPTRPPNPIRRLLDFLAKMGLSVRDDPPKLLDLTNRQWGPVVDNLALSVGAMPNEDPEALPAISIVLRNVGPAAVSLHLPPWLAFYQIDIADSHGTPVPLSPYGRELIRPERNTAIQNVTLEPGAATETQVPIGAMFVARRNTAYSVNVSCVLPQAARRLTARSEAIQYG